MDIHIRNEWLYSNNMHYSGVSLLRINLFQVQFIGLAAHTIIFLCLTDCDYPSGMKYVHITYMMTLTLLFSNFYVQSYLKKGEKNPKHTGTDSKKLQ